MFGSSEPVKTDVFRCRGCRGELFWLYDMTLASGTTVVSLAFKCVHCKSQELREVLPSMNEQAGSHDAVDPLPGQQAPPENMLICCREGLQRTRKAPDGVCRGNQFRVLERGNELFSRCAACGDGDSLGMINPAIK